MTLANRLFGDWAKQPHVIHVCKVAGLDKMSFDQLLDVLGHSLFDRKTNYGHIVISTPGRMFARNAIDMIAIGDDLTEAETHIAEAAKQLSRENTCDEFARP